MRLSTRVASVMLLSIAAFACVPRASMGPVQQILALRPAATPCEPDLAVASSVSTVGVGGDQIIAASHSVVWLGFQPRSPTRTTLTAMDLQGVALARVTATCPCTGTPAADDSGDVFVTEISDGAGPAAVLRLSPEGTQRWRVELGPAFLATAGASSQDLVIFREDTTLARTTIVLDPRSGQERWQMSGDGEALGSDRFFVRDRGQSGSAVMYDGSGRVVARLPDVRRHGDGFMEIGDGGYTLVPSGNRIALPPRTNAIAVLGPSFWVTGPLGTFEHDLASGEPNQRSCLPPGARVWLTRGVLSFVDERGLIGVRVNGRWWVTPTGTLRDGDDVYPGSVWRVRGGFAVSVEHSRPDGLTGRTLLLTGIDPS